MTTDFALGVESPEGTTGVWIRHAVTDAPRGDWARPICSAAPLVWVHEIASAHVPFPGYVPLLAADEACPDCTTLVAQANAKKRHFRGSCPD